MQRLPIEQTGGEAEIAGEAEKVMAAEARREHERERRRNEEEERRKKEEEEKKKKEEEEKKKTPVPNPPAPGFQVSKPTHAIVGSLLMFIIGISLFSYIYYLTPVHGIVELVKQQVAIFLPPVWNDFVFNFLPGLIILIILALYMLGSVLRRRLDFSWLPNFFYYIGAFYLATAVIIGIGYLVYVYLLSAGVLTTYICALPLNSLLQVDPNAAQKCLDQKTQAPPNTKEGLTQVEQISFGSEFTGGTIPTVWSGETYTLPFTIKNLDPDNRLNGVYVRGKMFGQEKVSGQLNDKLINFIPASCSADDPCSILPGSSQVISLQSEEKISFYSPGYEDTTIYTYFPYVGFGKGEVYAVASEADAAKIDFPQPESGPGPVDVVIFFAPEYFTADTKLSHIKMFIDVINRGQGDVVAKSMLIKRIGSPDILGVATCTVPGFGQQFFENNKQEFDGLEFKSDAQFSCDLPVAHSSTLITDFVGIPFTATFEYTYRETITDSFPIRVLSTG